jgi:hypothetical protein
MIDDIIFVDYYFENKTKRTQFIEKLIFRKIKFSINVKNTQQSEKLSKIIDNLR